MVPPLPSLPLEKESLDTLPPPFALSVLAFEDTSPDPSRGTGVSLLPAAVVAAVVAAAAIAIGCRSMVADVGTSMVDVGFGLQ